MAEQNSATLGYLTGLPAARFHFACTPCNRAESIEAGAMCAIYGEELKLSRLISRMVCKNCRKPVDGVFRTFTFSAASGLDGRGNAIR